MAARDRLTHSQKTRDKIQTSMILQRLENFIQTDQSTGIAGDGVKPVTMTGPQVTASLGILRKTLPDLQAVEHSGNIDVGLSPELSAWLNQS